MGLRKPPISILIQHGSPHSSPLLICEGVLHADPVERIVLLHQCPADWRSQTQHGASFFAEAAGDTLRKLFGTDDDFEDLPLIDDD